MALTPDDVAVLSRLLDESLTLDDAGREALLTSLPHAHRHLSAPLRQMLAQAATTSPRGGLALTLPRLGGAGDAARRRGGDDGAAAHVGERVGAYRLLREIGRGGMGSVWLAERADGSFERQVALKLPRLAWMEGLADRMARERRIGALLEHPNIARLYDAGIDDQGRPFIAMEYIVGETIDVWCRERGLDTAARLRLFVQVARAVAYAHGRLVIHRDLKPANVMVDARGRAHLLDFGIAKLLDDVGPDADITQQQGRVMTPSYAAPEQIAGQPVGVAADVYSLGVLLYELLTGVLPLAPKRRTLAALEEAVLQGDAPLASSRVDGRPALARALRGEVDSILVKAMKRDPGERYATADALVDDIERHLRGDTVSARPDTAWYRLRKAFRRHRMAFGAGSAVLVTVVVGSAATLIQAERAARHEDRTRAATQFVAEIFRASATAASPHAGDAQAAPGELLDQTARLIETRFAGQSDMQAELYGAVGRIYVDIGAGRLGLQYATRQLTALRQAAAGGDRQARARMLRADANRIEGHLDAAVADARAAVEVLAPNDDLGLEARADLAALLVSTGQPQEAEAIVAAATSASPNGPPTAASAKLLYCSGLIREVQNRMDLAVGLMRQAVTAALAAQGPQSLMANRMRIGLARRLAVLGRPDEAEAVMRPALDSLNASGDAGRALAAVESAAYWSARHQADGTTYAEARTRMEDARSVLQRWSAALPPRALAQVDFYLAALHYQQGNVAQADALIRRAGPVLLASTDSLRWQTTILRTSGGIAEYSGRHAEADGLFLQALAAQQKLGFARVWGSSFIWAEAAINRMMGGGSADAERLLDQAPLFPVQPGVNGSSGNSDQNVPAARARIRLDRGDIEGALAALPKPYAQRPESDVNYLEYEPFALRGEILCAVAERQPPGQRQQGSVQARQALAMLQQTLQASERLAGENDPSLARFRASAGLCALAANAPTLARDLAVLSRRAFDAQPAVSPWFKAPLQRLEAALGLPVCCR